MLDLYIIIIGSWLIELRLFINIDTMFHKKVSKSLLIVYLWCFGTTSPLELTVDLNERQGKSLARCLVRNKPQSRQRNKVAAEWNNSLSGFATGSHRDIINFV